MSGNHEHHESSSSRSALLISSRKDPDCTTSERSRPSATADSPQRLTSVRPVIHFYNKNEPHYGFTNFSPHPVKYDEKQYPTSEHLFQSFKFQGRWPGLAEHIRTCSDLPSVAFSEARRFQPQVRSDWIDVNIAKMEETLRHKFTQHSALKEELIATGDAELVENSAEDSFWGIGADRKGRNELGKALERLRAQFREAQPRILVEADPMME
ncbi:DUF1768-domain-containing protein [Laetiporus sulphureus 93-53]|uniref:DUF1768-domain-containing protein n=1 Tax=Laetiporus sulphureus 93-53 TaxID=1314785 RepID=A0A165BRX5_9APHY|nr:DUF1768-domain-containing protein [Laetiporus sulphureus 93-53]KZT01541.1 DUF1768-domain-containing protein [Laetiporus sulphureus 93-53]